MRIEGCGHVAYGGSGFRSHGNPGPRSHCSAGVRPWARCGGAALRSRRVLVRAPELHLTFSQQRTRIFLNVTLRNITIAKPDTLAALIDGRGGRSVNFEKVRPKDAALAPLEN